METLARTPNLTMFRVNGWQVYVWRDGDSVTLIDTGAPGSGAEIAAAVTGIDRIVLTHRELQDGDVLDFGGGPRRRDGVLRPRRADRLGAGDRIREAARTRGAQ